MSTLHFRMKKMGLHATGNSHGAKPLVATQTIDDPLDYALHPPADETENQRKEREERELNAKTRTEEIDKQIKDDAFRMRNERLKEKTILLLGQSEAGKTTTLKQMRMLYAPERQARLRQAWLDIIHLNVIMAVKELTSAQEQMQSRASSVRSPPSPQSLNFPSTSKPQSKFYLQENHTQEVLSDEKQARSQVNSRLLTRLRLAPLLSTESELRARLGAFEERTSRLSSTPSIEPQSSLFLKEDNTTRSQSMPTLLLKATWQEDVWQTTCSHSACDESYQSDHSIIVSAKKWTKAKFRPSSKAGEHGHDSEVDQDTSLAEPDGGFRRSTTEEQESMRLLIHACVPEIHALWLSVKVASDQSPIIPSSTVAYFLNNVSRIAESYYLPSDDDILHARVRTVGVYEERFKVDKTLRYRIIDVGGSRTQRNVWAQFFNEATAIIFLAPVSAFDETLREDERINRLKDSLHLWEETVASPLLKQVSLILFLNKVDLLQDKLNEGRQVSEFFSRYKGNNSFESVWRFFRNLFIVLYNKHRHKASTRSMYVYKTTATSTSEARKILGACQDIILHQNLKETALA